MKPPTQHLELSGEPHEVPALPSPDLHETDATRPWYKRRIVWGLLAGMLWMLTFTGGILIDSLEYRIALGWARDETHEAASVGRLAKQVVAAGEKAKAEATTEDLSRAIVSVTKAAATEMGQAARERSTEIRSRWAVHNFVCAMAFFTPTNLLLLALLAGVIGGCASNLADRRPLLEDLSAAVAARDDGKARMMRRRIYYLSEHPASSMMRSFIVYLILISGLYVISSDPFRADTQSQGLTQYMRLAGLVSLLGFIVGYDPTRFEQWLKLIPSPGRDAHAEPTGPQASYVVKDTHEEKLTVTASPPAQGKNTRKTEKTLPRGRIRKKTR